MGNFFIQIEAVGGHGVQRETKQGEVIDYSFPNVHPREPDVLAKRFVEDLAKGNSIVSATLTHWPESTPIVDNLLTGVREVGDFMQSYEMFNSERMLALFTPRVNAYDKAKGELVDHFVKSFKFLAYDIVRRVPAGAERTVALRKAFDAMLQLIVTITNG